MEKSCIGLGFKLPLGSIDQCCVVLVTGSCTNVTIHVPIKHIADIKDINLWITCEVFVIFIMTTICLDKS